jgi:hypothetical protein
VNKVLLSGKIGRTPEIAYTPKGRKIVIFPMMVAEGDFTIDIVGSGDSFPSSLDCVAGNSILVVGELVKAALKSRDVIRVNANKIIWMEE